MSEATAGKTSSLGMAGGWCWNHPRLDRSRVWRLGGEDSKSRPSDFCMVAQDTCASVPTNKVEAVAF